jgi:hypothetical protein
MGSGDKPKPPPPTALERELAVNSAEAYNRYETTFQPLAKEFINDSRLTGGELTETRGRALNTVQAGANLSSRGGGKKGLDSGSNVFGRADATRSLGAARGLASVGADDASYRGEVAGLQTAVGFGQGQSALAAGLQRNGATQAAQTAIAQFAGDQRLRAQRLQTAGAIAGAAAGAYGGRTQSVDSNTVSMNGVGDNTATVTYRER